MSQHSVASVLNGLIETSKDGENGFQKAAETTKDTTLKTVFTERRTACAEAVRELQAAVTGLGESPADSGTFAAALHRGWIEVKSVATAHDEHAILAEVERGEDAAKKNYTDALAQELPPEIRALVEKQYQGVVAAHDRVRDLRNSYAKT